MKILFIIGLIFTLAAPSQAISLQDWIKKSPSQKRRTSTTKRTTIAAVRGVDEPGEVDPKARDFESLKVIEERKVAPEKLDEFINEGKLKKK